MWEAARIGGHGHAGERRVASDRLAGTITRIFEALSRWGDPDGEDLAARSLLVPRCVRQPDGAGDQVG